MGLTELQTCPLDISHAWVLSYKSRPKKYKKIHNKNQTRGFFSTNTRGQCRDTLQMLLTSGRDLHLPHWSSLQTVLQASALNTASTSG